MLTIAVESPLSADGLSLIAGSEAALAEVFQPDEIFTLDPQQLAVPQIRFFVARDSGAPVGCVALMHCGSYGEVKRLYVNAAGRGKGTARALMAALEADARVQALAVIRLETGPVLVPAIALYRSLGYRDCVRFGNYDDHPASLFMEKSLGGGTLIDGHCLCGAVRFEFDGAPNWVAHCHCDSCRRNCSAPFTTYVGVPDGHWRWTGAVPATYVSSPGANRMFCATCGSPIAFRGDRWPGEIHFYAASLADPGLVTPSLHVNFAEHLPWIALADGLPVQ